jgi:hypothetical protein
MAASSSAQRSIPPAERSTPPAGPRAHAPSVPAPTQALLDARSQAAAHLDHRTSLERRSMARGLLLLAATILLLSLARAGLARVFVPGWWHQW